MTSLIRYFWWTDTIDDYILGWKSKSSDIGIQYRNTDFFKLAESVSHPKVTACLEIHEFLVVNS